MVYVPFGACGVSINIHGLDEAELFIKKLGTTTKTMLSDSLNKLAINTQKTAVNDITKELNLTKTFVDQKIDIEKSSSKRLVAKIRSRKRGSSLANYGAIALYTGKKRSAGVSVKVKDSRKKLKKAFMFRGKGGNRLVAVRTGRSKKDIKVLYGPSTSQALNTFSDSLEKKAFTDFDVIFNQELDRFI